MVNPSMSQMALEADQSPDAVERLLGEEKAALAEIGRLFQRLKPAVVTTAARGSSDHAATFFKYLFEISCGIPVASIGPSVASIYGATLKLQNAVHLTISQSGASPDIVALQAAAKKGGAVTIALVNVTDSPLAQEADCVLALQAGAETSVAATKSFIASIAGLAAITAAASGDLPLNNALDRLGPCLRDTEGCDWQPAVSPLVDAGSLYVAGRGPGFAIALEAALKAKETAGLHAEAFSLAEMRHGPMQLVEAGFPVIGFAGDDASLPNSRAALERLVGLGARVIGFSSSPLPGLHVPVPSTGSGLIDPVVGLLVYYRLIEAVTRARGHDPDRPSRLAKVTETV